MRYAQVHRGNKLHLVFEAEDALSNPICGIKASQYRMTINMPLGRSCKNCWRVFDANAGKKIRKEFFESLKEQA